MADNIITGRAKKYDGTKIDYVSVFNWLNGKCLGQIIPDSNGAWAFEVFKDNVSKIGVTYVADGCEPITHGAYDVTYDFNPRNPLQNRQGVWFQVSDLSTLFQDNSGVVPIAFSGQKVALMLDKSDNKNHARQLDAARRPIYRTDGTKHWLEFNGSQSIMTNDFMLMPQQGHTHVISVSYNSATNENIATSSDKGGDDYKERIAVFMGSWQGAHRAFTFVKRPTGSTTASVVFDKTKGAVVASQQRTLSGFVPKNDDKLYLNIDGNYVSKSTTSALVDIDRVGRLTIGSAEGTQAFNFSGKFYGLAHISDTLDGAEIAELESYIMNNN